MPDDELPHPFHPALMEELQHLAVAAGIGEPSPEIGLGYPIHGAYSPLLPLERVGQAGSEHSVKQDRKHEESGGDEQQLPCRKLPEKRQHHPAKCIEHEDVPAP